MVFKRLTNKILKLNTVFVGGEEGKSNKMRGFRGSTYGPASKCRTITITPELQAEYQRKYDL